MGNSNVDHHNLQLASSLLIAYRFIYRSSFSLVPIGQFVRLWSADRYEQAVSFVPLYGTLYNIRYGVRVGYFRAHSSPSTYIVHTVIQVCVTCTEYIAQSYRQSPQALNHPNQDNRLSYMRMLLLNCRKENLPHVVLHNYIFESIYQGP